MKRWFREMRGANPRVICLCLTLVGLGVVGFVWGAERHDGAGAVLGALMSSWLFFAGAVVGALAFSAVMTLIGAGWARPMHAISTRLVTYLPAATLGLLAICIGVSVHSVPSDTLGVGSAFFFSRELAGSLLLFGFGGLVLRPTLLASGDETTRRPRWPLVTYSLIFAAVGSLWAFDLVLGPATHWISTLIGPHLFVGAFITGAGVVLLISIRQDLLSAEQRSDAASLTLTLSIFWGYLFFSQLLTIWYGNLPDEVSFFIRRSVHGWQVVVLLVVAGVFVIPFLLLLRPGTRTSKRILTIAASAQLVGLWLERQLLVVPSLGGAKTTPIDAPSLLVDAGMAAVFILAVWPVLKRTRQRAA